MMLPETVFVEPFATIHTPTYPPVRVLDTMLLLSQRLLPVAMGVDAAEALITIPAKEVDAAVAGLCVASIVQLLIMLLSALSTN